MQWYLKVLRQYADFQGRARRTEYWMFTLINVIISIVLAVADYVLGVQIGSDFSGVGVLGTIFSVGVLVPGLAVAARRLHDTDRSGWRQALPAVPAVLMAACVPFFTSPTSTATAVFGIAYFVLGLILFAIVIVLIVWMATDGRPGPNRFGPNPKEVAPV